MLSPLRTDRIWLEKLNVQLAADTGDESQIADDYALRVDVGVEKKSNAQSFRVSLALRLKPAEGKVCRYKQIEIKMVGIFDFPRDVPEAFVTQAVPVNCPAILHGFARGVVAQITGLNQGGPFLLPTVNFVEALESKRSRRAKPPAP